MNLTRYTDYSLRVLIYVGLRAPERVSIQRISEVFRVSRNHLMKVVQDLARLGFVETARGRMGGVRLARDPEQITVGEVVRCTERFDLVECFDREHDHCVITPACRLKGALGDAGRKFLETLDGYTLADMLRPKSRLAELLER